MTSSAHSQAAQSPSTQRSVPLTVVMRSYNDAALLPRTFAALNQQVGVDVTLLVFESASVDDSPRLVAEQQPEATIHLAPGSYRSGRVLNHGMRLAETDLVAFVNSDAILQSPDVLRRLVDTVLADQDCAGAFAGQDVRPDASPMTKLDHDIAFEHRDELGDGAEWLSMVCSVVRRSAWEQLNFDERVTYAEDAVWSHAIRERGWRIRYVAEARCEHSHDYTFPQRYRRAYGDNSALAVIADQPPARTMIGGVFKPLLRRLVRDSVRLVRLGQFRALWRLPAYRWPQILGAWHGARDGWQQTHHSSTGEQPVAKMIGGAA